MLQSAIKLTLFYRCHVTCDETTWPLLQQLTDEACFTINNLTVQDNQAMMVLNQQEINRLRAQKLKVKVGQVLFL